MKKADSIIKDLCGLAETCKFGELKEELIRDSTVIGVNCSELSKSPQMDESLTLNKAIYKVRQAESISNQQSVVRDTSSATIQEDIGVVDTKIDFQGSKFNCSKCGACILSIRRVQHIKLNVLNVKEKLW